MCLNKIFSNVSYPVISLQSFVTRNRHSRPCYPTWDMGTKVKEVELSPWKEVWKLRLESCLTSKQAHRLGGWELGNPSSSVLEKDRHILWSNPSFRAEASGSQRRRVVCLEPLTDPSAWWLWIKPKSFFRQNCLGFYFQETKLRSKPEKPRNTQITQNFVTETFLPCCWIQSNF